MKSTLTVIVLVIAFGCACVTAPVTAQESKPGADAKKVAEYVARSQRLRDFGYPLLARKQLDEGKKLDPTSEPLLLAYVRLFTRSNADFKETFPYVAALRDLYPDDYDACLEIARFLFLTDEPPAPPSTASKEALKTGLARLDAEMRVYRELAPYVLKPQGDLPDSAKGKPRLPLAYLARCSKAKPDQGAALYLAARDLDQRGQDFDRWSRTDKYLEKPFGMAAQEVYGLVLPLYRAAAKTDDYNVSASVQLANLLFRMHRYDEASRAIAAAELLNPGDVSVARTRLEIADAMQDFELLNEALKKLDKLYGDITSRLDLAAAKRIEDNGWGFDVWDAYRELQTLPPGELAGAITELSKKYPGFIELYYLDARNAMEIAGDEKDPARRGRLYQVVLKALDKCKEMSEWFADWYGLRGAALWQLGRMEDAAKAYDNVAQLDKKDTEAPRHAAAARDVAAGLYNPDDYEVYRRQLGYGDLREKRKALRQVVTRSPKFFEAQLLLGKVAFMLGDWETAYGAYGAGHKLKPENLECFDGVARAAMHSDRLDEALKDFTALDKFEPDYQGCKRWIGILGWVVAGPPERRKAFNMWLEAQSGSNTPSARRKLLDDALGLEPNFPELLVQLAAEMRHTNPRLAGSYLDQALKLARDDDTRASTHREHGRLLLAGQQYEQAVSEFEAAYALVKSDGTDLLLAALTCHRIGKEKEASQLMRKLFDEVPDSTLLRPKFSDLQKLGLTPVKHDKPLLLSPAYDVDDTMTFHAHTEFEGKGGGQAGREGSVDFDVHLKVLEKPISGGVWRMQLTIQNAPKGFAALAAINAELQISPWFGLVNEPSVGAMQDIVGPVLQAITEGFTAGLGDAYVSPPLVWKNDLTVGPPHFGGDGLEASCVADMLGDSYVVMRRGIAGRQLGGGSEDQHNFSRALEANVKLGGGKRAIREVEFRILKKELTPAKDDVAFSRLQVKLSAK